MKQLLTFFCTITLIICSVSCTSTSSNRKNLLKLEVGMTKQQVLDAMGEPLKFETYHEPNIWFYYTKNKWMDTVITRDECTPIVFDNMEMVSGWGYDYYKKNVLFK